MSERIKAGDKAKDKGGEGYRARKWLDWWTFACTSKGCSYDADDRERMEAHVAVAHGKGEQAPTTATPAEPEDGEA